MALKYPPFERTDYNCLNPTLSCVRSILDLISCDKEIAEAEAALTTAKIAAKTQGTGLQKALLEAMKGFDTPIVEERVMARINNFRSLLGRQQSPINDRELHRCAENLYTDFAKLDKKGFEEWFKEKYADEIATSVEYTKATQSARGTLTAAKQRRKQIIADAIANDFRDGVPTRFRDRRQGDGTTWEEMAELILMSFYRDWKDRAPLFDIPVSVTGVAIYSMNEKRRETWFRAYQALGLDKLPRRSVFQYLVDPSEGDEPLAVSVLRGGDTASE